MTRRIPLLCAALSAALLLSGCSGFMDTLGDIFSSSHKSDLRGLRVSLIGTDEAVQVDPTLAGTPILLPPPYRNSEWPQPGGFSANVLYHLEAPGPLRQIWSTGAGKGTDDDSMLTASPVVAAGRIYVLDAEAHVRVFRQADGKPLWDKRLAPKTGTDLPTLWGLLGKPNTIKPPQGMGGGIAFDDGKVYGALDSMQKQMERFEARLSSIEAKIHR
jgi:outer membrane protein assembly factor BamB